MAIDVLSALKIAMQKIKKYVDDKQAVSYGVSQDLDKPLRETAKNNIGV